MRNVLKTRNVWNCMPSLRWIIAGLFAASLFAQGQQDSAKTRYPHRHYRFSSSVQVVVAPVTVTDRNGDNVDGLQPEQFHLFDNGKEQTIKVDVSFPPISIVIAVQANDHVESVLPQINKIGDDDRADCDRRSGRSGGAGLRFAHPGDAGLYFRFRQDHGSAEEDSSRQQPEAA